MSKVDLKNIFLKGTNSGPSFRNIKDLRVENMTFIGGQIEGRALEVDGQTQITLEQVINYIKENIHGVPEVERAKIKSILDEVEIKVSELPSDESKARFISYAFRTVYDICISVGGTLIPQFLAPYI